MEDVVVVLAKTLAGGVLVSLFALLSDVLKPKRFGGLLGAAPSVALAGLVVATLADGPAAQVAATTTMVAGAVGLLAYCLVAAPTLGRLPLPRVALLGAAAWVLATGLALLVVRVVVT